METYWDKFISTYSDMGSLHLLKDDLMLYGLSHILEKFYDFLRDAGQLKGNE